MTRLNEQLVLQLVEGGDADRFVLADDRTGAEIVFDLPTGDRLSVALAHFAAERSPTAGLRTMLGRVVFLLDGLHAGYSQRLDDGDESVVEALSAVTLIRAVVSPARGEVT